MSGACYENGLLGKPAGEPGLAEYFSDVDGVCVKDSSYVPCPDLTCCDIDALACFSSRATRERPLPAAAEASNFRDSRQPPPTLRDLLPVFPRPAADRPSPPRAASSAVCRSSPSPPATVSCSASASSSPSSPPPWYVHAVRSSNRLGRQLRFGVSQNAFLDFPRQTHTQGFRVRSASDFSRNRFVMSTRQRAGRKLYFVTFRDDFFVLAEKIVRWKKNAPPLMNLPSR